CVARIARDLVCNGAELGDDGLAMALLAQQRLDPGLRAVILGHVALDEHSAEQDADTYVGERAEGEDPPRARHERVDVGVLALKLLADGADRLVDQWDPEFLRQGGKCSRSRPSPPHYGPWTRSPRLPPSPCGRLSSWTSTACWRRSSRGRRMHAYRRRR